MKKLLFTIITSFIVCGLCGCDSSQDQSSSVSSEENTLSVSEKTALLLSEVEFPSMVEIDAAKLEVYFGISEDDVTEFSAYICGSGAYPDEFGIFVAKDAQTAAAIKTAVENRIEAQRKTYTDYTPAEVYKLDDSFVNVNGNTVCYAICADNERAGEILG